MTGYIYAIECSERIKIGFSKNPEKRFYKIASDAPAPCALLGYWPGDAADELEVHTKFNAIRSHGEWFTATAELLTFIARHAVPMPKKLRRFTIKKGDKPLAVWRKTAGLTQTELGQALGVGASFISQLESGYSSASLPTALKLFEISGGEIPPESLLSDRDREAA